jgi:hypothetical protein
MKVFNLCCRDDHRFEGWFGSSEEYDTQLASGLLVCPICGSDAIRKLPAAPHLNLSKDSSDASAPDKVAGAEALANPSQAQAAWLRIARHIVEHTDDVGEGFAEEARRIHYQEAPTRGIRGVASAADRSELEEEGIEVFSFPLPKAVKSPLQ